jgi:hypothetical protein
VVFVVSGIGASVAAFAGDFPARDASTFGARAGTFVDYGDGGNRVHDREK